MPWKAAEIGLPSFEPQYGPRCSGLIRDGSSSLPTGGRMYAKNRETKIEMLDEIAPLTVTPRRLHCA